MLIRPGRVGRLGSSRDGISEPSPGIATPNITSPADSATDIGETPTITSSAFAVTLGGSDMHASSDWQVASDSGFSTIVAESLDDASNLESWAVPSGNLSTSTTYYVRVRHTGTTYGDSGWSISVSFTTASAFTDADAQAVIDNMTTTPSSARQTLIDNLVKGLKTDGVWNKLDRLWVTAAHNTQAARLDWKNPAISGNMLTEVSSPTFTVDDGYSSNGSNSYLNSNFTPSTDGVNYTVNSASALYYVSQVPTGNTQVWVGGGNASNIKTLILHDGNGLFRYSGFNNDISGSSSGWTGAYENTQVNHYAVVKTSSTSVVLYRDGTSVRTHSNSAPDSILDVDLYILAENENSTAVRFNDGRMSYVAFGGSLTSAEVSDFRDRLNTYMTGL